MQQLGGSLKSSFTTLTEVRPLCSINSGTMTGCLSTWDASWLGCGEMDADWLGSQELDADWLDSQELDADWVFCFVHCD